MPFNIDAEKQCPKLFNKLPKPHNIFLSYKEKKIIKGFLIEECPLWQRLEKSFEKYFLEEVLFAAKRFVRETTEPTGLLKNRVLYLNIFKEGLENAQIFDTGREFLKIYLLAHLKQYKKLLPEVPNLLASVIPDFPIEKAEELKIKIFYGLWQEIGNLLNQKESKAYEFWQEIFNAPQFFLEKDFQLPQNYPWIFGEVYYKLPSEKIKRYFSDAIIQAKDFLNSKDGKKIIQNFIKKEISIEEALCSVEILNILPISEETLNFMEKFSLNMRYGEIFKDYLDMIYFCKKIDKDFYFEDLKLDPEVKPLQYSLAGIINPLVYRFFFLLKIKDLDKKYNNMVFMDEKSYRKFLKEKEEFEKDILSLARKSNVFFEKYTKDGMLFTSRTHSDLFDFIIQIFIFLMEKEKSSIPFDNLKGFSGKGSFYLLPFLHSENTAKYDIFGTPLEEAQNILEIESFETPYIIISYNFLETLFENLKIESLEIYKTKYGSNLKVNYKGFHFILIPYLKNLALIKPKIEGELISTLEPQRIKNKITELLETLKNSNSDDKK